MDLTVKNSPAFWDSLAKPCSYYERKSAYAAEFLEKSGIRKGESVFDMGCGSGTLCLPLADEGHEVFCADFSPKMLQSVSDTVKKEGISLIHTRLLSWQEPWPGDLPVCDLAFASRCLFDADPEDAVRKLSAHAARKVCVTLPVDSSMFSGTGRYEIGSTDSRTSYLLRILAAAYRQGFYPELSYMKGKCGEKGWAFLSWETRQTANACSRR